MGKGITFGCRPLRKMRSKLLEHGPQILPKSWRFRVWIIARIKATPPWADFDKIKELYAFAKFESELTGIHHSVDHIIPLNHPRVCGLHIAVNMRVIPHKANMSKSNYFCPEQLELFE